MQGFGCIKKNFKGNTWSNSSGGPKRVSRAGLLPYSRVRHTLVWYPVLWLCSSWILLVCGMARTWSQKRWLYFSVWVEIYPKKSRFNFSILTWYFQPGLLLTIFLALKIVNKRGWVVLDDRWEKLHSTLSNLDGLINPDIQTQSGSNSPTPTGLINPDIQTRSGSNPPTPSTNNIAEGEKWIALDFWFQSIKNFNLLNCQTYITRLA